MRTVRCDAMRSGRRLISIAGALLLAACGGPYAWNQYLDADYGPGKDPIAPPSSVPAQVNGIVGAMPAEELRSIVAAGIGAPPVQGSGPSAEPPSRTVWTLSGTSAPGQAGTNVHVEARYYRDDMLVSIAEGNGVLASGEEARQLRELVADVAGSLVPSVRRGGPGRG